MVQGFGNVGLAHRAHPGPHRRLDDGGGRLEGLHLQPDGINPFKLAEYVDRTGSVIGYPARRPSPREQFFASEADIFVPAALELEIGEAEARPCAARLIVEAPTAPPIRAPSRSSREGHRPHPDILANSGGVCVSYYEWLQNKRSEIWDLEEVEEKLAKRMKRTYLAVSEYAATRKCDWRTAAMSIALGRLAKPYSERGNLPLARDCPAAGRRGALIAFRT
jgi:glutamate dehydrogenase (NAD(P)+)